MFVGKPLDSQLKKRELMNQLNSSMDELAAELPMEAWN
jgi:hypothetical protein